MALLLVSDIINLPVAKLPLLGLFSRSVFCLVLTFPCMEKARRKLK